MTTLINNLIQSRIDVMKARGFVISAKPETIFRIYKGLPVTLQRLYASTPEGPS